MSKKKTFVSCPHCGALWSACMSVSASANPGDDCDDIIQCHGCGKILTLHTSLTPTLKPGQVMTEKKRASNLRNINKRYGK